MPRPAPRAVATALTGRAVVLAVACLLATLPPAAAEDRLPPDPAIAYRVVGVGGGDSLALREDPDPAATLLERLAPSAGGLVVTGTRVDVDASIWWEVVRPSGGTGWVNARYLAEDETAERATGFPLQCHGTEPFWGLRLAQGEAVFDEAGMETRTRFAAEPWMRFPGRRDPIAVRFGDGAAGGFLAARPDFEGCSDGMSDRAYPYAAIVGLPDGSAYEGCCARAE